MKEENAKTTSKAINWSMKYLKKEQYGRSSFWRGPNPPLEDLEPHRQPGSEVELPPTPRSSSARTWVGLTRSLAPPPPNPDWLEEEIGPTSSPFLKGRSRAAFWSGRRRPNRAEEIRVGPRRAAPRPGAEVAGRAPPSGPAEPKMLASATPPLPGSQLPPASPFPLLLLAVLSGPASGRVPRSVPRTSLPISGGVLYAATVKNYLGTEPIISRAVGRTEDWIRTETLPSWLNAPAFAAAMALSPAEWGDEDGDDEIYFFFTETSRAFDSYERIKVPRVARVCAGDLGGRKTLQHRWTTFLKADLLCPGPEHGRASSILQDVAILRPEHRSETPIFYGIFSSQWEGAAISAVCAFRPQDIRTVLNGPFRELKHDCNRGLPVMDNDVPQPRPGECITNNMKLQQFGSSLSLPDRVLTFIRDHPLMDRPVFPTDDHPLLVTTDTAYLRVVAHRVTSLSGKEYDVLYLGTEDGHLHRAVRIGAQLSVLEDLALFPEPQPVESMKLYQNWLLVGSRTEVTQVNTTNCGRLQSCSECILAQDPVCAWSFQLDACVAHAGEHGRLVQDIESADVSSLCPREPGEHPVVFEVPVATAAHVVLPCSPSSAWASCVWHQPGGVTALTPRRDGLEVVVTPGAMGAYACECQEGGAARVVAAYSLVWGSQRGPASQAHTVGAGLAGFVLGVLAASLTLLLIGRRQQRRRQRELLARDKVGLDLGAPPSGTTSYSQDPPSPSPEDERLPLALAKRGSGFGGFPPPFLLDPCPSPAHIRLTGAPLATCDETSI
ncbi:semaphorin-4F isoform X4 [Canis lupus dingo]|uniref:semaphorin-4F isoform X4 n=1 Tax=Canis lupus dingo TaxID=286419 RepID=UPI0020C4FAD9|nr:semaphorin-4F isoform X4 [Canis lupus dingo]